MVWMTWMTWMISWISWIWILSTLRFTKWVPGGWRDGEGCFDSERQAWSRRTGRTQWLLPPGSSSRVRGRKWILKRKNASCWSNNDSNGWRCSFGNLGIGKIYPKSLQSIFHKGAITFHLFFAVMRVQYVILAVQLQLLRTFKSYSSAKLFPSSAVMRCYALDRRGQEATRVCGASKSCRVEATNRCRKLEHPWIIIQWKSCKRQIKEFHLQNVTRLRWFHTRDCRTWLGFISLQAIRKSVTNYLVSAVWHGVAASHDLWCECRTSKKPPKTAKRKLKVRRWAVGVELPKFCRWFWCRETSESLWKRAVLLSAGKLLITVCLCFPWISVELVPASLRGPNVCFMISWDHRLFP